jgi:tripartite-type tricarboxylate transporter receptor subunit TctC
VIRFVVMPKGTPADRKAYVGAAVRAAMHDPELVEEYKKTGAFFDPKLANSKDLPKDLGDYAGLERAFYQKTGRLK